MFYVYCNQTGGFDIKRTGYILHKHYVCYQQLAFCKSKMCLMKKFKEYEIKMLSLIHEYNIKTLFFVSCSFA